MADYSLLVNVAAVDKASAVFKNIQGNVNTFKNSLESATGAGTSGMEALGQKMQTVGNNMTSTGKAMTASVTVPIVALGTAAVKTAANFDSAMSEVSAVSGATGKDLDDLRAKAREMGSKTKFSATEAASGFKYMAMAGWKTADMLDGIEGIMNLAAASGEDLATTSDIVTDALTAFGLQAKDSGHFADVLAAASSNANTNVSMMGETFKYAAPIAGSLGYSAEDTALAIGLMANSGIKASQAGTSLRTIMTKLTGDIQIAGQELGNVTIQTTNADGSMREFSDIIMDCREAFSHLSESEKAAAAESLVGKNAMSGFLALMNAGDADVQKLTAAIQGCDGASKSMADTMNDNLEGQLTILKSQLQELAISAGEVLVPVIRDVVSIIQKVVDWFNQLSPATKEAMIKILALTATIGPLLMVGGKLVGGIGKLISAGSKVGGLISGIGSSASAVAGPVSSAGSAMGGLSKNALGFVGLGAGILLCAAGFALLAQASIALAEAGWPAIAVMGGMVLAIAGLMALAAALGPALTTGAVGLLAFGAAILMVGAGALLAATGMAILAPQLPTIAEYGLMASVSILALGAALGVFAVGCIAAGAGALVLAAGLSVLGVALIALGAGALVAGAGITVLAAGITLLGVGVLVTAAGIALTAAAMAAFAVAAEAAATASGSAAANGLALTAAMAALLVPAGALAALLLADCAALLAFDAEMGLGALAAIAMTAGLVGMLASMAGIAAAASSAANNMKSIQNSLDITKAGVQGLGDMFDTTISKIISIFQSKTATIQSAAQNFGKAITDGIKTGMQPLENNVTTSMDKVTSTIQAKSQDASSKLNTNFGTMASNAASQMAKVQQAVSTGFTGIASDVSSQMQKAQQTVTSALQEMQNAFRNTKFDMQQYIALPHFSMSGKFNAETGATPTVNVDWYKKAYDQAYMFNTPTVFGAAGFGDGAGTEVVVGDEHLLNLMREAIGSGAEGGGDIVIPVYIGQDRIDEIVVNAQQRKNLLSGGR